MAGSAYGTKLAEAFAQKVSEPFYQKTIAPYISNRNYEGQVKDQATKLNILSFDKLSLHDYSGSALSADSLLESNAQLVTDQKKAYYFKIKDFDQLASYIKDPKSPVMTQLTNETIQTIDNFLLAFYPDVGAGNRVGTDYTTGTVGVTTSTGAVAGSGTTFTAAMVGRGFKATGHTSWYRVKTYSSTTAIVIEDDSDDLTSAYTGGTISGGATYTIEANTAVQATATTIYGQLVSLKTKLDKAKVPMDSRSYFAPADIINLLIQSSSIIPAVPQAYQDSVVRGAVTMIAGFLIFSNEQVAGDSVNGYRTLATHNSWLTFAEAMVETGLEEDLIGDFGKAYKGLRVYGAKVVDNRRIAAAEGFFKL